MTPAVKARIRRVLVKGRDRAIAPLVSRLDRMQASNDSRLDELNRRVAGIEAIIEVLEGRAATVSERSVAQGESQIRLSRRLAEIEKMIGNPPADE